MQQCPAPDQRRGDAFVELLLATICMAGVFAPVIVPPCTSSMSLVLPVRSIGLLTMNSGEFPRLAWRMMGVSRNARKLVRLASLVDADPRDAMAQSELSDSDNKIGDMLAATGDAKGAMARYHNSIAMSQKSE